MENNYNYVLNIAAKSDILLLAESWKEKWTGPELRLLENMGKIVVSQAATRKSKIGRPTKGTVWILSKDIQSKFVININFISDRISKCTIGDLTIIGVYMPSTNSKKSTYELELKCIETHLNINENCFIIGDFNGDVNRSHFFTSQQIPNDLERYRLNYEQKDYLNDKWLKQWLDSTGFVSATKQFLQYIPYTFQNTQGHNSWIDHVIIKRDNKNIISVNIETDDDQLNELKARDEKNHKSVHRNSWPGQNIGDHLAIMTEVIANNIQPAKTTIRTKKIDWNKESHREIYSTTLQNKQRHRGEVKQRNNVYEQ